MGGFSNTKWGVFLPPVRFLKKKVKIKWGVFLPHARFFKEKGFFFLRIKFQEKSPKIKVTRKGSPKCPPKTFQKNNEFAQYQVALPFFLSSFLFFCRPTLHSSFSSVAGNPQTPATPPFFQVPFQFLEQMALKRCTLKYSGVPAPPSPLPPSGGRPLERIFHMARREEKEDAEPEKSSKI